MNCSQWGACQPLGSPQGGTGLLFGGSLGFPPVKGRKPGFLMKGGGPRSRKGTNVSSMWLTKSAQPARVARRHPCGVLLQLVVLLTLGQAEYASF